MPVLPPITEPSARITKIAFLLASGVGPPAWFKYHCALLPGRYEMAVELNTCPDTITYPGRLGITRTSPARTSRSVPVFFQRLMSEEMRMAMRPTGGFAFNCSRFDCHCCIAVSRAARSLASVSYTHL